MAEFAPTLPDDELPPIDWQAEADRYAMGADARAQQQAQFRAEAPGLVAVLPDPSPTPGVEPTGMAPPQANATPGITQSVNPADAATFDPGLGHGEPSQVVEAQPPVLDPGVAPIPHAERPPVGEVASLVPPGPEGVDQRTPADIAADQAAGVDPQAHLAAQQADLAAQHAGELARKKQALAEQQAAQQDAARARQLEHQRVLDENAAALDAKWQELYEQKLDPNNWFNNLSGGQKAVVGIASIFGPLRGLYNDTNHDTMAEWVSKQIDRDLETQKENLAMKRSALGQRQNLLGELRAQYGSEDAGDFAYVAMKQQQGADALDAWSATYAEPEIRGAAKAQAVQLRQQALANRAAAVDKAQKEAISTYVEAQKIGQKPVYDAQGRVVGMAPDPTSLAWYNAHKATGSPGEGTPQFIYAGNDVPGSAVPLPPNLSKAQRAAYARSEKELRSAEDEQRKGADEHSDKAGYKARLNNLHAAQQRHMAVMQSIGIPPELIMRARGDGPGAPVRPLDPTARPAAPPQTVGAHGDVEHPLVSPDLRNDATDILHPEWAEVQ